MLGRIGRVLVVWLLGSLVGCLISFAIVSILFIIYAAMQALVASYGNGVFITLGIIFSIAASFWLLVAALWVAFIEDR